MALNVSGESSGLLELQHATFMEKESVFFVVVVAMFFFFTYLVVSRDIVCLVLYCQDKYVKKKTIFYEFPTSTTTKVRVCFSCQWNKY